MSERTARRRGLPLTVLGVAVLAAVPWIVGTPVRVDQASQVLAYAVAILGLDLVMGYSGQISIGHSAFVGLGAYTTVILVADHGVHYLVTLPVAFAISFAVGVLVGLPALRIQGLYLAAVTLAIAVLFPLFVSRFDWLTGGPAGKQALAKLDPPAWTPFDVDSRFDPPAYRYLVLLAIAVVMFVLAHNLLRSRVGRSLIAIREAAASATAVGVPVSRYKVIVFGVSAGFAGVAGSMLMIQLPLATENRFGLDLAILLLVALVVGGISTMWGAIPGAIVLLVIRTYVPKWTGSIGLFEGRPGAGEMAGVFSGLLLMVVVFAMPGGVIDGLRRLSGRHHRVPVLHDVLGLGDRSTTATADDPRPPQPGPPRQLSEQHVPPLPPRQGRTP